MQAKIFFTSFRCGLGWLLVARTERGVCRVRFGEDPRALAETLRAELPWAELVEDAARLAPCVRAIERYLAGRSRRLELPLDVRGSQFQRRVWDALRAIPYGETRSYAEVAGGMGRPGAARAVARACGANPVALVIPCHRVVGSRGALGGYHWGPERKARLLELESKESDKSLSFDTIAEWSVPRPRRSRPAAAPRGRACSTPPSTA